MKFKYLLILFISYLTCSTQALNTDNIADFFKGIFSGFAESVYLDDIGSCFEEVIEFEENIE